MQSVARLDFQSNSSEFESRRPRQFYASIAKRIKATVCKTVKASVQIRLLAPTTFISGNVMKR